MQSTNYFATFLKKRLENSVYISHCGTIDSVPGGCFMQIYNTGGFNNNKRFATAVLVGIVSAIGLGLIYGLVLSFVRIQLEIMFIGIGWCIGTVIQKYGRGVGKRFCVLGAVCTFLAIVIGDLCAMYGINGILYIIGSPAAWGTALTTWVQMNLSTSINNLLGILFRIAGIYFGYHYSSLF